MSKDYMLADVDKAEIEIRAAVPDVIIERSDFGFGMNAIRSDLSGGIVVFQPKINDQQQEQIITPVQDVISYLKPS